MKKLINITLGFILIITQTAFELYPTIKMSARIYLRKVDFNNLINSEPLAEHVSFLSDEEKTELASMFSIYLKNMFE